jgi:mxaJ protein
MSFASRKIFLVLAANFLLFTACAVDARELRICGDPNNLPFSNKGGEGFENKIASKLAAKLGAKLSYVWWAQRRGFLRNTLNAGACDLVTSSVLGAELLRTTLPYYRSSYMFVTRADRPSVTSLDDPRLRHLKIGIQLVGDNGNNPPPAEALARRGLASNVRGFPVYGDDRDPNPGESIITAVANTDIDIAIVWGPLAGFYAKRQLVSLKLSPVEPQIDGARLPMLFDISMGVRKGDDAFKDDVNQALVAIRPDIDRILSEYGVPRFDDSASAGGDAR